MKKAENQLTKEVEVMLAILAGLPPSQIIVHTLACFPEAFTLELENIFCVSCLETRIVSEEDLAELSLLQKKTKVPDKPDSATTSGKKKLLTLSARFFSQHSLLHVGYRDLEDKEKLVTERHRYNLETVEDKVMQKEFVVASPQQQQVIASFAASPTKRHLVLEGPAGTGKTLVAMQVAKNLLGVSENSDIEPQLVVTSWFPSFDVTNWSPCFGWPQNDSPPLMEYLDTIMGRRVTKICKSWKEVLQEVGVSLTGNVVGETYVKQLLRVSQTQIFSSFWYATFQHKSQ